MLTLLGSAQRAAPAREPYPWRLVFIAMPFMEEPMKWLNLVTLLLVILGGIDMGVVALDGGHMNDIVAKIFGGVSSDASRIAYGLIGLSALWQIVPFMMAFQIGESHAEANR
jgi:hypothetical protein